MTDYIKREDVLSLKHRLHNHSKDTIELYPVYVISPDAVEKIPSADVVEVKHGEWKWRNGGECSECGFHNSNFDYNFCPNCGADMRKAGE